MHSKAELWEIVWKELGYHAKPDHSSADTLARLIRKHVARRFVDAFGQAFEDERISPRLEHWTTEELGELWRGHAKTNVKGDFEQPIVVLRVGGADCLIDGSTWINKRIAEQMDGTHEVIVLAVEES